MEEQEKFLLNIALSRKSSHPKGFCGEIIHEDGSVTPTFLNTEIRYDVRGYPQVIREYKQGEKIEARKTKQ